MPKESKVEVIKVEKPKKVTTQELITKVTLKEENLEERIERLEKEAEKLQKSVPWYKSFGVWLSIILVLAMFYFIWLFYMSEKGHNVLLPWWMR